MNNEELNRYINAILEKSSEAYLMALEIINKPTINYRTEGFCFFICNAWELLLKAFIIRKNKDINSINFKKGNRTIGLDECINMVFTSTTDKVKANLTIVRSIRNKATHLILPEHDIQFAALFQQCLTNYNKFFQKQFPEFEINNKVMPFISLVNIKNPEPSSSLILNPMALVEYAKLTEEIKGDSLTQTLRIVSTKKESEADLKYAITKDSTEKATIINIPKDISRTHPYTFTNMLKMIQDALMVQYGPNHGFTKNKCLQIIKDYKMKENQDYCYLVSYGTNDIVKYSDNALTLITSVYLNSLKQL